MSSSGAAEVLSNQNSGNDDKYLLFGDNARKHFYLEESTTCYANHGSYGTVPRQVMEERFRLLRLIEAHPDRWFRCTQHGLHEAARIKAAAYVGADPDNFVFVPNATTAFNAIVKSSVAGLVGSEDACVLCHSHIYKACEFALERALEASAEFSTQKTRDAQLVSIRDRIVTMDMEFPIDDEQDFISRFVAAAGCCALESDDMKKCAKQSLTKNIKLAVIDHITSASALVLPVRELTRVLQARGILVLIDGAHAPGHIPDLNIEAIGADFYVGNLHKWCFAPKGAAFLWVNPKHRGAVRPLVTSHFHHQSFPDQYYMQGTLDHTPYICTSAALDFYNDPLICGGQAGLQQYACPLLDWAQSMLCEKLRTQPLPVPQSMVAPFMRVLRLPVCDNYPATNDTAQRLIVHISENCPVVAAVLCFSGSLWLRISANMYSTRQSFLLLCGVLEQLFF